MAVSTSAIESLCPRCTPSTAFGKHLRVAPYVSTSSHSLHHTQIQPHCDLPSRPVCVGAHLLPSSAQAPSAFRARCPPPRSSPRSAGGCLARGHLRRRPLMTT